MSLPEVEGGNSSLRDVPAGIFHPSRNIYNFDYSVRMVS